jgi:replicative DNA helicase
MSEVDIVYLEQNILACCISKPVYILDIEEKIFLSEQGQELFKTLRNLYISEATISKRNIVIDLNKKNVHIKEQLIDNLFALEIETDQKSFNRYYRELKEQRFKFNVGNEIIPSMLKESSKADVSIDEITELVQTIQDELYELNKGKVRVYDPERMFSEYEKTLYARQDSVFDYSTGDSYLDSILLEKFQPGRITTIFGPSGVGKSAFALFLVNRQLHKMIPSMYITLEMTYESTMDRLVAQVLDIPVAQLYPEIHFNGEIEEIAQNVIQKIKKLRKRFEDMQFFELVEEDSLYIHNVESRIRDFKTKNKVEYAIVTIDLLTMLREFNIGNKSKADKYEDAMNLLHEMARRNNVHVVGVVQGKRINERLNITDTEQLERFRPQVQDIKNSGAIYERSRAILGVFRKKHFANLYIPNDPNVTVMPDVLEVDVLKQNMGRLGRIKYLFEPETYRFMKLIEHNENENIT